MFAQNISFVCSLKLRKALKEKAFTSTHVDMGIFLKAELRP